MQLAKILTPERILVPIPAGDKMGVIAALIDLLAKTQALANRDAALQAVLKRESERTTGIGYGLAIPHGKTDGVKSLVMAAGKPAQPVNGKWQQPLRLSEFMDGTSNTILVVEAGEPVPWAAPEDIPYDKGQPLPPFNGPFPSGFYALFGDASVRFIEKKTPQSTLRLLIERNDGQAIPAGY